MPVEGDEAVQTCCRCRRPLVPAEQIGRREMCPHCGADLHACLNCRFYDSAAYNACREPQAERVLEKERANFCDYFDFRKGPVGGLLPPAGPASARDRLDALFSKGTR